MNFLLSHLNCSNLFLHTSCLVSCACQAEIESRVELEKRLKQAEEALQDLEKGLNSVERTKERDEKMKGDVSHLRSECTLWYTSLSVDVTPCMCCRRLVFGEMKHSKKLKEWNEKSELHHMDSPVVSQLNKYKHKCAFKSIYSHTHIKHID